MRRSMVAFGLSAVMLLGAGCSSPALSSLPLLAKDLAAEEVDLQTGSMLAITAMSVNPIENLKKQPERVVTMTEWVPGDKAAFTWNETFERETAASITARSEAERATGVGEASSIPEPVYETITLAGSIKTEALNDGSRLLLPSNWPESDFDAKDSANGIIWLSKAQYDELVNTRHTHLSLGLFDAGLQTAADAIDSVQNIIDQVQGHEPAPDTTQDITEVVADVDWGTYTMMVNGAKVNVQIITAENGFAKYKILANPENPLVLQVELKSWALGLGTLGLVTDAVPMQGYRVERIDSAE